MLEKASARKRRRRRMKRRRKPADIILGPLLLSSFLGVSLFLWEPQEMANFSRMRSEKKKKRGRESDDALGGKENWPWKANGTRRRRGAGWLRGREYNKLTHDIKKKREEERIRKRKIGHEKDKTKEERKKLYNKNN